MAPELKQQKSLIHGLPDHIVADEILPRVSSWWDYRCARAVSKSWKTSVNNGKPLVPNNMLAAIHRVRNSSAMELCVSVYDPQTGRWERMPPIPGVACGAPLSARCACVGRKLYVIGGRSFPTLDFLSSVYVLDLRAIKKHWMECSPMNTARSSFACVCVEDKIVVAGGQGEESMALDSVELYDPRENSWRKLPELEIPRAECTGALVGDNLVCVIGGYTMLPSSDQYKESEAMVPLESTEVLRRDSWELMDSNGIPGDAIKVTSGILNRLHFNAYVRSLKRCERKWRIIEGKMVKEDDSGVMLMGIIDGTEEYATCCRLDAGNVETSLRKTKHRIGEQTICQDVELPFDVVPAVSCCSCSVSL